MYKMQIALIVILFVKQVFAETQHLNVTKNNLNVSNESALQNNTEQLLRAINQVLEKPASLGSLNTTEKLNNIVDEGGQDIVEGVQDSDDDKGSEQNLYEDNDEHEEEEHFRPFGKDMVQKPKAVVVRCSRRFTPGTCTEPVTSVWTYSFDQQNCTERLGCPPQTYRTNSFKSYNRCNRVCMALGNVYTLILDMDQREIRDDTNRRRLNRPLKENKDAPTLPPLSESYSDNEGRPISHEYYDSLDRETTDDEYNPVPIDKDEFEVDPEVLEDFHRNLDM